jgi:endonuclease/exonuclease/phosphatase family metal-dependent hydrolase
MDIRIITYNVHCFPWIATPIKEIAAWIVRNGDIAALQEVWYRHTEWAAAFAAHGWVLLKPARESHFATVFGSGLALVYPSRSWQVQDARFYPFLRSAGLDSLVVKGWFRVDLLDPQGRPIRIINTHMQADIDLVGHLCPDYTGRLRKSQARQLMDSVSGSAPIVIGDMNTGEHLFNGFSLIHGTKLDHCAVPVGGPWSVKARVGSEAEGWSDHLPVSFFVQAE